MKLVLPGLLDHPSFGNQNSNQTNVKYLNYLLKRAKYHVYPYGYADLVYYMGYAKERLKNSKSQSTLADLLLTEDFVGFDLYLLVSPINLNANNGRLWVSGIHSNSELNSVFEYLNANFTDAKFKQINDNLWLLGINIPNITATEIMEIKNTWNNAFLDICGNNLDDFIVKGRHHLYLVNFINEVQMLLHGLRASFNSIWLWDKVISDFMHNMFQEYVDSSCIYTDSNNLLQADIQELIKPLAHINFNDIDLSATVISESLYAKDYSTFNSNLEAIDNNWFKYIYSNKCNIKLIVPFSRSQTIAININQNNRYCVWRYLNLNKLYKTLIYEK